MKHYLFRHEGAWAVQHLAHLPNILNNYNWFVQELFKIFNSTFNGENNVVCHDLEKMQMKIAQIAEGAKTISIDPCVEGDFNIGTSRIFLPGGKTDVGIGNRPGFPGLETQMKSIPPGEYVLVEDDIFSGGTLRNLLDLLTKTNPAVEITKLACGIQVGRPAIEIPIESLEKFSSEEVLDLNDPRDFLVGSFGGGLVIQRPDSQKVRAPYLLPFVDTNARSSVPREKVLEFGKKVWRLNIAFWQRYPETKLWEVEKYFFELMKGYGYTGQEAMVSVCQTIYSWLPSGNDGLEIKGKMGAILLDLNGTLITSDEGKLNFSLGNLRKAIRFAQEKGWDVGLCSDSPHGALCRWGLEHGITGPIVSENGLKLNDVSLGQKGARDFTAVKNFVINFAKKNSIDLLGEIYAKEFDKGQLHGTGIAFGAGRSESLSVFCLQKNGRAEQTLTEQLGKEISDIFPAFSVDCSPPNGFIGVHADRNFRLLKGKTLRELGWALYLQGKELWMVGDSVSDISFAPALCKTAIVGNGSQGAKNAADLVTKEHCTRGVIEILLGV